MPTIKWKVRLLNLLFTCLAAHPCYAQSAPTPLQTLVETSARRLLIGAQVALAKWDTGAAVEDAPREEQVIRNAVQASESKGLDSASVSGFFKAQIEANKLVQYSLLADWKRAGDAPAHNPVNLVKTIRPELDRLQTELIDELAATKAVRSGKTCPADIAKAVGQYVAAHPRESQPVYAIALDRALAASCQ
jgi:chorismate mutase